jgi:hypothetical protein
MGMIFLGKPLHTFPDHAVKFRPFIGYPMAALTGSSAANMSMTYPVVI